MGFLTLVIGNQARLENVVFFLLGHDRTSLTAKLALLVGLAHPTPRYPVLEDEPYCTRVEDDLQGVTLVIYEGRLS